MYYDEDKSQGRDVRTCDAMNNLHVIYYPFYLPFEQKIYAEERCFVFFWIKKMTNNYEICEKPEKERLDEMAESNVCYS